MLETLILFALVLISLFTGIVIGVVSSYRSFEADKRKAPVTLFSSQD